MLHERTLLIRLHGLLRVGGPGVRVSSCAAVVNVKCTASCQAAFCMIEGSHAALRVVQCALKLLHTDIMQSLQGGYGSLGGKLA